MENSSVASASSEAGSTRSQEIEELERFIDSYVLEYQVQGLLGDKADGDLDLDNGGKVPQWTDDCNNKKDGSWTSSRGRGSFKPDEWEHSSNGSTGSRPSSGSRPGSGSRSGSRGRNNQFIGPAKNGNRDGSFDILGTDIWAANTMDSHGGAGWDVQPEKLDFSHFHRKHIRGTPKHLPHIDREGMNKTKFEEDDGIDMNDIERFLPHLRSSSPPATVWQGYIIQSPRLRSTHPANIHFPFPEAGIDLQIGWGRGKHLVCVCGCVSDSVRKGFLLLPSNSAAPLLASLECQPVHTITLRSHQVVMTEAFRGQRASI